MSQDAIARLLLSRAGVLDGSGNGDNLGMATFVQPFFAVWERRNRPSRIVAIWSIGDVLTSARRDIHVVMKDILRIPLRLEIPQPSEVRAVGNGGGVARIALQVIHVASGREER